jgi:hypothetical protein
MYTGFAVLTQQKANHELDRLRPWERPEGRARARPWL